MSNNAGFATLQIIPSARNFGSLLRKQTESELDKLGKDAGKKIGDDVEKEGSKGSAKLGTRIKKDLEDAGDKGGKSFAQRFAKQTGKVIFAGLTGAFKLALDGIKSLANAVLPSFIQNATKGATTAATDAISSAGTVLSEGTAMTAATDGLNLLVGALLAVAAAAGIVLTGFTALAPVVLLVGGVLGAAFTVLAGAVGSLGVFLFALHGVSGAFGELTSKGKVSSKTLKTLAPSARSFFVELSKLIKPLKAVATFVQGKFFASLGKDVAALAKVWLPALRPMLGGLATDFNKFAQSVLKALGDKTFVKNIQAGIAGFGAFIVRIGQGLGPFIDMWGRLAAASVPFLGELGDEIAKVFEGMDNWIKSAEKSGALKSFMSEAAANLNEIWTIGGLVIGIVGDLIKTFFPQSRTASGTFLGAVTIMLANIKQWLDDPKNQQKIRDWIKSISDFVAKVTDVWIPDVVKWFSQVGGWIDKVSSWGSKISAVASAIAFVIGSLVSSVTGFVHSITFVLSSAVTWVEGLPGKLVGALAGLPASMFSAGADAGSGFLHGLKSSLTDILGAGGALGSSLVQAARSALDSHSPSRKMIKLGLDTADGMRIGVQRGTGRVTKAMRAMVAPPDFAASRASSTSTGSALVGSLTVNAGQNETTRDALEEAMFALRRISRGGVYA